MKVYYLTGKFGPNDSNFVQVRSLSGAITYAVWPMNKPYPKGWGVDTKFIVLCGFEDSDTQQSRPYVFEVYPLTKNVHSLTNADTQYVRNFEEKTTENSVSTTFGGFVSKINSDGTGSLGGENSQYTLRGEDTLEQLNALTTSLNDLIKILVEAYAKDAPAAGTYGFVGTVEAVPKLPPLLIDVAKITGGLKKVLSTKFKID